MDIKLHYIEQGSGEPLILLHGNGEDSGYFASQISFFSSSYRVIAVDTRGHGKSPRGVGPFTLDRFSDDLKSFLDELSIDKAVILGFSDGANIALLFTLKYPEYVSRLILNGATLRPSGVTLSLWLRINAAAAKTALSHKTDPASVRKRELLRLMTREPHISKRELSSVSVPTLVIAGDSDMIRGRHTKSIGRGIPGSRTVIIPGTHFIARDSSEEFNRQVNDFLLTCGS